MQLHVGVAIMAAAAPARLAAAAQDDDDGLVEREVHMQPPDLTEEEQTLGSHRIPPGYECDACAGIAYTIEQGFQKAEAKYKTKKRLREGEIIDVLETVCQPEYMAKTMGYGIRGDSDVLPGESEEKLLCGPGIPHSYRKSKYLWLDN